MVLAVMQAPAQNYSVTPVTEPPTWEVDLSYDLARPSWQEPASGSYENWTVLLVDIESALKPYTSADDLMALFVGNQLRGLAKPAVVVGSSKSDASTFLLKLWGNESSNQTVDVTLKYYNSSLKNVFSLTDSYTVGEEQGIAEDFVPPLSLSSAKYPVLTSIDINAILAAEGITPKEGDIVGAFKDDDCRGVSPLPLSGAESRLPVYAHEPGESVIVKYYDAANGQLLTLDTPVPLIWPGDVNRDGKVNVVDVTVTVSYILGQKPEAFSLEAADINGDGKVDSTDVTAIRNMIMMPNL